MVTRYPPAGRVHEGRGTAPYAKQLARALRVRGWEVHVLAERLGRREVYEEDGVHVHRVWRMGWAAVVDIRRAARRLSPDLIHVQHELFVLGGGVAAFAVPVMTRSLRRLAPVVSTIHGVIPVEEFSRSFTEAYARRLPPAVVRTAYAWILREMVRWSNGVIVHGEAVDKSLRAYRTPRASFVIPHGMAALGPMPDRATALEHLGLGDCKRAVFVGYLLPYKGVDILERAAPLLAEAGVEVVIAGAESGDTAPSHRPLERAVSSGVRRLGFVPEESLPHLFALSDVLVLPYKVGLSASGPLTMAAAFRVPAAVSDVPTLVEAVRCPDAVFRRGDEGALARTVERIVSHQDVADRIVEGMSWMSRDASWDRVAELTTLAYREVVDALPNGCTSGGISRDGALRSGRPGSQDGGHRPAAGRSGAATPRADAPRSLAAASDSAVRRDGGG